MQTSIRGGPDLIDWADPKQKPGAELVVVRGFRCFGGRSAAASAAKPRAPKGEGPKGGPEGGRALRARSYLLKEPPKKRK